MKRATPQPPLSQHPQTQSPLPPGNSLPYVATTNSLAANERVVYFQVVLVQIQGEKRVAMIETFAILDDSSSDTLIRRDIAAMLCLGDANLGEVTVV